MRAFSKIAVTAVYASLALGPVVAGSEQRRPENAQAQQGGGDRSGPAQPPLWLPDEQYLRWPLPPSGQAYARLDAHRIIDHAFYHTNLDTAAIVPEAGLEAAVRAFAKIIDEVNTVDLNGLRAPRASEQGR